MELKYKIIMLCSSIGSALFGEFDVALQTLMLFMAVDFITGLIVAGVFKKSLKSDDGRLQSNAGFKGIARKCMMLLCVLVGYRIDMLAGINIVRNSIITAFIVNEVVSINENAVLMGVDVPSIVIETVKSWKK